VDRAYLEVLAHALAATEAFRPSLVFYNAGVDPHERDRLGRLALTDAGLRARDALVTGWARRRNLPLAGVLGGGYDNEPRRLAARHAILFEEAARAAA
jgi:acetoin utilization deacetylase AcuC-like enzyme